MNTLNRSLTQRAYKEAKKFLIIAFYLWSIFALMLLYKSVILGEPIGSLAHGFAIINALALGKVILIGRAFHLGGLTTDEPLILPTLKKSGLFSLLLAIFKILEDASVGFFHGRSFQQSVAEIGGGTLKGILCLTLIMFVVLIPFFGFTELQELLGEGKLAALFLHRRSVGSGTAETP